MESQEESVHLFFTHHPMTASQLIEELKKMPQDQEVFHYWETGLRSCIKYIWLSREGMIVTCDDDEWVFRENLPKDFIGDEWETGIDPSIPLPSAPSSQSTQ